MKSEELSGSSPEVKWDAFEPTRNSDNFLNKLDVHHLTKKNMEKARFNQTKLKKWNAVIQVRCVSFLCLIDFHMIGWVPLCPCYFRSNYWLIQQEIEASTSLSLNHLFYSDCFSFFIKKNNKTLKPGKQSVLTKSFVPSQISSSDSQLLCFCFAFFNLGKSLSTNVMFVFHNSRRGGESQDV